MAGRKYFKALVTSNGNLSLAFSRQLPANCKQWKQSGGKKRKREQSHLRLLLQRVIQKECDCEGSAVQYKGRHHFTTCYVRQQKPGGKSLALWPGVSILCCLPLTPKHANKVNWNNLCVCSWVILLCCCVAKQGVKKANYFRYPEALIFHL